jgi:serine/threonine protein kinase/tetratricopeptide (TPR) repeat protein
MPDAASEKSIFLHAAGLDSPAARAAYLDEACGHDPAIRARIEALLAAHDRLGGNAPPSTIGLEPSAAVLPVPEPGAAIGPYKLVQQIGEGGMGIVWMAQQTEPVKRVVAVKLIKAGMDSRQVIARFEAERQALALMDHPNIAPVLDAGTTDAGRPYFVMDLVKGVPITKYCDEHHLTPRQRLELFLPVCQAIQHAHQKGIIHRDLKPSNVLIALYDGKPVPKVIDFGVAKAAGQPLTDKTLVTGFGHIVGTLEYMSPEQAEINQLDIDTRSDIYSLGVLLYELLAGSPPFRRNDLEKAGILEMLRVIREQEPSKPSTKLSTADALPTLAANRGTEPAKLTKLLRGELDWIVMKALEKDRSRRYETANGFAMDVLRYLADEPVLACPPSGRYRLRKFAQRNRRLFATLTAFVIVLVLATAFSTWQALMANRAKQDALAAAAAEMAAKDTANAKESETSAVLDFVEQRILAAARPKGRQGGLGPEVALRAAIEASVPFVEKGFKDQPLTEARLRRTLGISYWHFGDGKAAAAQFEPACAIYKKLLGPDNEITLNCGNDLGISYGLQGHFRDAIKVFEELLPLCKANLGPEHHVTLGCLNNLARNYFDMGEYEKAMLMHQETVAIKKAKYGPGNRSTLLSMVNLANVYHRLEQYPEALRLRLETWDLQKTNLSKSDYDTLMTAHNIGANYRKLDRNADALRMDEETLKLRRDTLGRDHPDTLNSLWSTAKDLVNLGRNADAIPYLDECLSLSVGKFIHPNFFEVADLRLRHFEKAKNAQECRMTAELWEKQRRPDAGSLYEAAVCRAVTAVVLLATDKSPEAARKARDENDQAMAWLHRAVAEGYKDMNKLKKDKDLDGLRDRPEFKKLLAKLETGQGQERK